MMNGILAQKLARRVHASSWHFHPLMRSEK